VHGDVVLWTAGLRAKRVFKQRLPAIHVLRAARFKDVDARNKPGHDDLGRLSQSSRYDTDGSRVT
jgi:hypothetical protein